MMKPPCKNKQGILIFLGAFLAPCLLCFGQTNATQPGVSSPKGIVLWEKAAKGYTEAQRPASSSHVAVALNSAKARKSGAPADGVQPGASNDNDRMNAESESAQYQRIEQEGLLQTRQAMKAAEHDLTLQRELGLLSRNPEALCLGNALLPTRILGTGTASGVP